jgi:hypothetical protein
LVVIAKTTRETPYAEPHSTRLVGIHVNNPGDDRYINNIFAGAGPTFTPGWGEWRGYTDGAGLEGQLDDVFNGVTDLETAIDNATEHVNTVLERYYPE